MTQDQTTTQTVIQIAIESGSNNNVVPPNSPKNGTNASNKNEAKDSKEPLPDTGSEDEANTSLIWDY